jgi:hypothetical protein
MADLYDIGIVMLRCSRCKQMKSLDDFRRRPGRATTGKRWGRWSHCRECERASAKTPQARVRNQRRNAAFRKRLRQTNYAELRRREREGNLRRHYGFGEAVYDKMFEVQGGVCAICRKPPHKGRGKRLHVDHDHISGKVRGLLCSTCNSGLGHFEESQELLRTAITYLDRAGT